MEINNYEEGFEKVAEFEKLLDIYGLPKEADWFWVTQTLHLIGKSHSNLADLLFDPHPYYTLQKDDINDLLHLIKIFDRHKTIIIQGGGTKFEIKEGELHKWLRISLHNLLYKVLELGDPTSLTTFFFTEQGIKVPQSLEGEGENWVEAFSNDSIEKLADLYEARIFERKKLVDSKQINRTALGSWIVELASKLPEEALQLMDKTSLLNFCGDLLALTGALDKYEKWNDKTRELYDRPAYMNTGDARSSRMDLVEYWVKKAIEYHHPDPLWDQTMRGSTFRICKERVKVLSSLFSEGTSEGN